LLCSLPGWRWPTFSLAASATGVNRLAEFSKAVAEGQFAQPSAPEERRRRIEPAGTKIFADMSLKIRDNINELRSEKEKFDSILRCMVEGLVVIDPKGKVSLINEQAKIHVRRHR
jgi:signal transduction histidine kinase